MPAGSDAKAERVFTTITSNNCKYIVAPTSESPIDVCMFVAFVIHFSRMDCVKQNTIGSKKRERFVLAYKNSCTASAHRPKMLPKKCALRGTWDKVPNLGISIVYSRVYAVPCLAHDITVVAVTNTFCITDHNTFKKGDAFSRISAGHSAGLRTSASGEEVAPVSAKISTRSCYFNQL